jgi:hypothetical protein
MGHGDRSGRHARHATGHDDLRLELVAVYAAATATADFIGNSLHVSTKRLVEKSILERTGAIKVPRRDAYDQASHPADDGVQELSLCAVAHRRH